MIKGNIGYDKDIERYVIYGNDGRERELHCGDYFEVYLGLGAASAWIGTTIEMRRNNGVGEWYLTVKGLDIKAMLGCEARYGNEDY